MPHTGTALARFPMFLIEQAEAHGLDRKVVLREAHLTRKDLDDPDARIQARKTIHLWRVVMRELDNVDLGIRFGQAVTARAVGLVGYTLLHSATLGEALERLVRYGSIIDETYPPKLEVIGDRAEYSLEPIPEQRVTLARLADFDLVAHLAVVRELTGVDLVPLEVHFPYLDPPRDLSAHRDFFRCEMFFDQPLIKLVLKKEHLALPVRNADLALGRYLEELADKVLASLVPAGGIAERVERELWIGLKDGRPNLESVAFSIHMSPRTLQRRLRKEDTSFAELLDKFRHRMATALLEDHELAIYEIAFLLGYSEPSTFYRAFRRWTDTSPQEFRTKTA